MAYCVWTYDSCIFRCTLLWFQQERRRERAVIQDSHELVFRYLRKMEDVCLIYNYRTDPRASSSIGQARNRQIGFQEAGKPPVDYLYSCLSKPAADFSELGLPLEIPEEYLNLKSTLVNFLGFSSDCLGNSDHWIRQTG